MKIEVTPSYRVCLETTIDAEIPPSALWGQVRAFPQFAVRDAFHIGFDLEGPPRAGARYSITHRFLGVTIVRRGRVLRWDEGVGYAFSDVAIEDGRGDFFPHVFEYRVLERSEMLSTLRVRVRGVWRWRFVPRVVVAVWMRYVMVKIRVAIDLELLRYAAFYHELNKGSAGANGVSRPRSAAQTPGTASRSARSAQ